MKPTTLNHEHPKLMEARYIEEVRKMTPQQRFEKLMAIIEISYHLKKAKKISK
jgi:predicted house-cleaning noncanonical NTP pyrophosphatase (MazG superfamily)